MWECPYRVVKDTCELRFSESFGPLDDGPNRPSCGLLGLGEPRSEWLLSCLGKELSTVLQVGDK